MYDVLVIGAGSAGCVIANRASEDPNRRVLLLEAGPDYPDLAATPFDLVNSHNNSYTDHDWGFTYSPTPQRDVFFPRGRVTGGSSAVNTTIALRALPEDFEEWVEQGNPGWAWPDVLPAFNRLERDLDFGAAKFHGDAGPITVRRYPSEELLPQHAAFLQAADKLGYPYCADANDPSDWGAGPQPMNKLGRLRVSCAVGYLAPARVRPNLTIRANAEVERLLFEGRVCTGVRLRGGTPNDSAGETIRARLVVLCAGALMSPTLLMRSGVGRKADLETLGIRVVSDMPGVGQNLHDHPAMSVVCRVRDPALIDHDSPLIQTILRYTAPGSSKRNDLQIEQLSFVGNDKASPSFGIAAVLEYQYGSGSLRLRSASPEDPPLVDCRYLEDARDLERLVGCFKEALRFAEQPPLADMIEEVTFPRDPKQLTDETIASLCQRFAGSGFHPSGTAKMGPSGDPLAVVDALGCCHGVDQLVVADASIMPTVPRANTNLTSIMIGEVIGERLRTEAARYGL